MHLTLEEQGDWLRQAVMGFFAYHAVPTNADARAAFRDHVIQIWRRLLRRRSQKDRTTWEAARISKSGAAVPPRSPPRWLQARAARRSSVRAW
jgi:RNA-directed DNA polymerase